MNKKTELAFIILTAVLVACTAQAVPAPTETPTAQPPMPTAQPSATARPTVVPTVTPTPLSPDAQVLKDIVFSDCIPVEDGLPEGLESPWNIWVGENIIDLEDGAMIKTSFFSERIPEDASKNSYFIHVSPDGKWLAYPNYSRTKLYVEPAKALSISADEVERIVVEKANVFHLLRWMDNEAMLAIYAPPEDSWWFPTVIINPFMGEEHIYLLDDLPNYLDNHFGGAVYATHYQSEGELVLDPTMKRLIYPTWGEESDIFNTLWDVEKEKTLARLRTFPCQSPDPLWAQDGSDVLVVGRVQNQIGKWVEEWFLISADGDVQQITQFNEIFQDTNYYFAFASRSWDGRFLVFQLAYNNMQPDEGKKYVVLDLSADSIEGYCIPLSIQNWNVKSPLWSPDNRYLVISDIDQHYKGDLVLLDIENKLAYKIGQDMGAIGWIVKPEGEK